jgi:hypothetical protein
MTYDTPTSVEARTYSTFPGASGKSFLSGMPISEQPICRNRAKSWTRVQCLLLTPLTDTRQCKRPDTIEPPNHRSDTVNNPSIYPCDQEHNGEGSLELPICTAKRQSNSKPHQFGSPSIALSLVRPGRTKIFRCGSHPGECLRSRPGSPARSSAPCLASSIIEILIEGHVERKRRAELLVRAGAVITGRGECASNGQRAMSGWMLISVRSPARCLAVLGRRHYRLTRWASTR